MFTSPAHRLAVKAIWCEVLYQHLLSCPATPCPVVGTKRAYSATRWWGGMGWIRKPKFTR